MNEILLETGIVSNSKHKIPTPFQRFFFLFFFSIGMSFSVFAQHDLSLTKTVDKDSVGVGDVVVFTLTVHNDGATNLTNVEVKDSLPGNLFYMSHTGAGSYNDGTGIWDIGSISSATASVQLNITARVDSAGLVFNQAEISQMDGYDFDSTPNNKDALEDDIASACVSVVFLICPTFSDTIVLNAPSGLSNYQWFRDVGSGPVQVATTQTYNVTQAGEYTFTADQNTCEGGNCCPIIVEEACFDLALDKKLEGSQSSIVSPGDNVTFTITIHNQGDIAADSILITDYLPTGMTLNDANWGGNDTLLTVADGALPMNGLAANGTKSINITMTIDMSVSVDSLVNYAEISAAEDFAGRDNRDVDSNFDANDANDPGGASGSPADDYILGDGTGTVPADDEVAATDEDDHDPARILICPTITNPIAAQEICSGETVATLSVETTNPDANGIAFVYFSSARVGSAMYTGGTSLGNTTAVAGTASITNVAFPANAGATDVIYYVYAILNPTPSSTSCRPAQEIQVTVHPIPVITAAQTDGCSGDALTQMTANVAGGTWSAISTIGTTVDVNGNVTLGTNATTSNDQDTIVYTANSCTDTVFVITYPTPTITAADLDGCSGDMLTQMTVDVAGGTWSAISTIGTSVDGSGNVTLGTNGTASNDQDTIVYNANGCTDTVFVITYPTPTITAAQTADCSGETLTQMTVDVAGGTWSAISTIGTSVDASGNVTLGTNSTASNDQDTIVYNANGCTDTVFVITYPTPTITAADLDGCSGDMLTQMTVDVAGGTWSAISTIGTAVDASGNVTLGTNSTTSNDQDTIVYNANGCTDTVFVITYPTPTITAAQTADCSGETLTQMTVDVAGGTWSAISTIGTSVDASGNVTLGSNSTASNDQDTIVYNANGCTDTVFVITYPTPTITAADLDGCSDETLTQMTVDVAGGTWSAISTIGTAVDASGNVTLGTNTGIINDQDTIVYNANGCTDTVFVITYPTPVITATETDGCSNTALAQMTTNVGGGTWSVISTIGTTVDVNGNVVLGTNGSTTNDQDTIIYNANGCADSVFVITFPTPIITATDTEGCSGESLTQMTTNVAGGTWSAISTIGTTVDGSGNVDLGINMVQTPDQDTIVYAADGCTDTVFVTVNPFPLNTLTVTDTSICNGEDAIFLVQNSAVGVNYQLRNDATDVNFGPPVPGNGGDITFNISGLTSSTTFNVLATNTTTNCAIELVDKAVVTVYDCDWGDLPDLTADDLPGDYQTLTANNGPSHFIIPDLKIGPAVDAETDGQQSPNADGDDADEDGFTFPTTLSITPGGTIRQALTITNLTGSTSYIKGWIDWNNDGDFEDTGEMVIDLNDSAGYPALVTFAIPTTAVQSTPLGVRFRLSNDPITSPNGRMTSGEIEDYLITIDCPTEICLPIETTLKEGTK